MYLYKIVGELLVAYKEYRLKIVREIPSETEKTVCNILMKF